MIDEKTVRHIAHLARIGADDVEIKKFAKDLAAILEYVRKLEGVATANVREMRHVAGLENSLRDDSSPRQAEDARLPQGLKADLFEEQAPGHREGEVRVPRVLE